MHRTQIYLQDVLYETLRQRAHSLGLSMSELIRRSLEKEVQKQPANDAQAFFEQLQPLASFSQLNQDADVDRYVRQLRGKSRLLHTR